MLFTDFQLNPRIQKALVEQGYSIATPIQEKAIPLILEGKDFLGRAQTGTGKTAAFALPILEKLVNIKREPDRIRPIKALIIAPTRELAIQIGDSFERYGKYLDLRIQVIFGGIIPEHHINAMKKEPSILVATPGRLLDFIEQAYVDLSQIDMFVLDEADRMLDLGMIKDVIKIMSLLPINHQTMLFSATMPKALKSLVKTLMKDPVTSEVESSDNQIMEIKESLYLVDQPYKIGLLLQLLEDESIESVIIFTKTRRRADKVSKFMKKAKIRSKVIHGGRKQEARQSALEMFRTKKIRVLIATDIAARGIDIKDLTHVINLDLPQIPETYIHRIGRTGRAGQRGSAISLCTVYEVELLQAIEKEIGHEIREVEDHEFRPLYVQLIRDRNKEDN